MRNQILEDKLKKLREILESYGKITIAFSGGVDSTFLLCFAKNIAQLEGLSAITANGCNFSPDEIEYGKKLCIDHNIHHITVDVDLPEVFFQNPEDRCYHCKKSVFSQLMGKQPSGWIFCDGSNADDSSDYRPGSLAARELGVKSPLLYAELTKAEIRTALKAMDIEIWDKPAFACLASRIPYGTLITEEKLAAVYRLEILLRNHGFTQVRVRHHGEIARIELLPDEMETFITDRPFLLEVQEAAKGCGFSYTALDILGYQMGSLNQTLKGEI